MWELAYLIFYLTTSCRNLLFLQFLLILMKFWGEHKHEIYGNTRTPLLYATSKLGKCRKCEEHNMLLHAKSVETGLVPT